MNNEKIFLSNASFYFSDNINFWHCLHGQVKKDLPKEKVSESILISANQQKYIKSQSLNKGDNVHCSLQDKAGNLWFGTTGDGVYKYDGKSFTQFTTSNGLNHNSVNHMLEDKDGKIWIGTAAGLVLYDGKTFAKIEIALPKNMPPNQYHNTHDVFSIMQDKSGKLWLVPIPNLYAQLVIFRDLSLVTPPGLSWKRNPPQIHRLSEAVKWMKERYTKLSLCSAPCTTGNFFCQLFK